MSTSLLNAKAFLGANPENQSQEQRSNKPLHCSLQLEQTRSVIVDSWVGEQIVENHDFVRRERVGKLQESVYKKSGLRGSFIYFVPLRRPPWAKRSILGALRNLLEPKTDVKDIRKD